MTQSKNNSLIKEFQKVILDDKDFLVLFDPCKKNIYRFLLQ